MHLILLFLLSLLVPSAHAATGPCYQQDATGCSLAGPLTAPALNGIGLFVCTGSNDTATVQAALNTLAAGKSAEIYGICAVTGALTPVTVNGGAVSLLGKSPATLNIGGGNNGPAITLQNAASLTMQGLSILRTQTSPTEGQTGLSLSTNVTSGVYQGIITLRDLTINGGGGGSWQTPLALNSVGQTLVSNVIIQGPNGGTSDTGDSGILLNGPTAGAFTSGVQVQNGLVQGYSVGIRIGGFVQGVLVNNSSVIGDYDGVLWNGLGPNNPQTTTAATTSGKNLQFAIGSLATVLAGDVVTATNVSPGTRVSSVNNSTGVVVLGLAVTGTGVANAATVTFQRYYTAEQLNFTNGALNAYNRGVLCIWCSLSIVSGNSILDFNHGSNWAAVEFNEGNNNAVVSNPGILGPVGGSTIGIIFSSASTQGSTPNVAEGNIILNVTSCVWLEGTTSATTVTGNTFQSCPNSTVQDTPGSNAVFANNQFYSGQYVPDITSNESGATMTFTANGYVGGSFRFNGTSINLFSTPTAAASLGLSAGTGTVSQINLSRLVSGSPSGRWTAGENGTAESGGNVGSDFEISAFGDTGSLLSTPVSITRGTGIVNLNKGLNVTGAITANSSAGVSCSGAPTASFASTNGIVTHC